MSSKHGRVWQATRFRQPMVVVGAVGALAIVVVIVYAVLFQPGDAAQAELLPVDSITHEFPGNHLHGLGYNAENEHLVIATHYGLFVLTDEGLYQLGPSRDDFMGFSIHPHDPNTMYSSGHPRTGGNLGVMLSSDGGATWQQIFRGVASETVDFHAMTLSAAHPQRLWGAFQGRLYYTLNGGKTWDIAQAQGLLIPGRWALLGWLVPPQPRAIVWGGFTPAPSGPATRAGRC